MRVVRSTRPNIVVRPVPDIPMPPHRRKGRGWLYAVIAMLVFFVGASVVAGLFFRSMRVVRSTRPNIVVRPVPDIPMPPHPPVEISDGEMFVSNEGAEVSGQQTVITKTYPLASGGAFALHNISGNITVEGWDEEQAEVKIIKRGGSEAQRDALRIAREQNPMRLALSTTPEGHRGVEEVEYEVKLPRSLRELEIVSNNSNVELVNMEVASISINVQRGNIELEDVGGTINSRTTKGNTRVRLTESRASSASSAPQVFNGIHGNIELELASGTNAELKAETIDGDIEIDEELGIKVEKRMVGRQAVGRIGKGGAPIVVKTVSGNIKITN
jgi:hypothetical protein